MESSRMIWIALTLLALMLAAAPVRSAQPVNYRVGGTISNPNWFPHPDSTSFYQDWADQLTVYVNDTLHFLFDGTSHDVTLLQSASDLSSCSIADRRKFFDPPGDFTLTLNVASVTVITSSGLTTDNTSIDCQEGMQFSINVLPRESSTPPPLPPPPPPPVQTAPSPTPPPSPPGGSLPPAASQGEKGKGKTFPVAAVAAPAVVVSILVLALVGFLYCRRQYGAKPRGRYPERRVVTSGGFGKSGQASAAISDILKGNATALAACTMFTYAELERATRGFSADTEVGSGGFGTVYKGTLDDGRTVAIKMAKHASDVESFVNEVAILSQVNNRNLVKLLGCCIDVDIPLLVYEFIANGTLQDHLSVARKGFYTRLDWNTRFRIALQTAEALKYLHVQATPPIFHRDVKTANILLDHNFNGKVADFGLSKLVDLDATHVSTVVKGTPGYLDPEYFHNFQLTDKTDVYSFGVVLLELITAKRPIDLSNPAGEQNLAVFSIPLIRRGRVCEIIDSFMSSSLSPEELQAVEAVAQVAVACLVSSRPSRPSMSEVVEMLQRIKGSKLKAEEFYKKADVTDSEGRIIGMQDYGISLGDSASTTRGTSSSGSGTVTEPMRPR